MEVVRIALSLQFRVKNRTSPTITNSNNQKKQGKDFGYRFLWRLVLLTAFATLNAAFFPAGDVLLLFVIVGLVLFFTRNWSDKAILTTSIISWLSALK